MKTLTHAIWAVTVAAAMAGSGWAGVADREASIQGALTSQLPQVEEQRGENLPVGMEECLPVIVGDAGPATGVVICP